MKPANFGYPPTSGITTILPATLPAGWYREDSLLRSIAFAFPNHTSTYYYFIGIHALAALFDPREDVMML
jgi:hypothetical protein